MQLKQAASTQSAGSRESGLDDLDVIARRLMGEVEIKDRTWLFKTYKRCFLGTDLVKAMVKLQIAPDVKGAVAVGNQLMERRVFHHVWEAGFEFKNSTLFYRFSFHEELLGECGTPPHMCPPHQHGRLLSGAESRLMLLPAIVGGGSLAGMGTCG